MKTEIITRERFYRLAKILHPDAVNELFDILVDIESSIHYLQDSVNNLEEVTGNK